MRRSSPGGDRPLQPLPHRGRRRFRRRRVHLRPRRARVARGAGADPRVRPHATSCPAAPATPPTTSRRSARAPVPSALVGDDDMGRRLRRGLARERRAPARSRDPGRPTPTKTRILAGGIHSAKQQVVRIDRGTRREGDAPARELVRSRRRRAAPPVRRACWSPTTARAWCRRASSPSDRGRAARTRTGGACRSCSTRATSCARYRGLTASTPNEAEVEAALGEPRRRQPACSNARGARCSTRRG